MNVKFSELLMYEHEVISHLNNIVTNIDKLWQRNPGKFEKTINDLLVFLKEYSDNFHHKKEEKILFPAMIEKNAMLEETIIGEMNEQHNIFRDYVKEIKNELENKNYEVLYKKLMSYVNELLEHIAVENDELFPMAESLLSEKDLENIYYKFLDIDAELGNDKKNKLEKLVFKISSTHNK